MDDLRPVLLVLVALSCGGGCGGRTIVPLLSSAGIPITRTPTNAVPLEVVTRSTSVRDPLPVAGTGVVYGDFEAALGHAVSSAAVPWADKNRGRREGGWQLFVEVIQAEAEHDGSRLLVTVGVRATLRARIGGAHIAQTETACRDGGLVPADKGAPVLYACMTRIGRDLTSWLAAAEPEQPGKSGGRPAFVVPGGVVGESGAHSDSDDDGDSDAPGEAD
ncbi:MAG TPA: hypothetical protein VM925_24110 [Labilithrix sp.]|nr:hypothetical protein [Labilithrix sp.]